MQISYSWLQSYFEKKLPKPDELAEILTMHSQEVESVEEKDGDFVFNVKVTPDRAYDYVDYFGVIRDIAAALKLDAKINLPEPKEREIIPVKIADFEKILGVKIPEKEITEILIRLGMEVKQKDDTLFVGVPSERPDLKIKEDVIEEAARIYGYDKIEEKAPEALLTLPERNDSRFFAAAVRNILVGLGFSEVYSYSFVKKGELELQNPIAKDKKFLRINLTDGLLETVKNNTKYFKDIKLFEIGKIFPKEGETLSLAAASNKADFYEMKGAVDAVLEGLGITDFYYETSEDGVADIRVGNTDIGVVNHNHLELNLDELVKLADEEAEYRPISKYPAVVRDIAVFAPIDTKVIQVEDVIQNAAGELLQDDDLFDIYENDERKSLAFHLIFQSPDKTLTDTEVNEIMEKIFAAVEANPDWEVRK
ncbi:MAG: hypothetical protein L6Q29_00295 [Candidatus Pacebacteria bacterium]|nr:hypothetical protein [Candidatus Paceibacterota bacterium]NUQ57458.1 hypothetical protein [Candidatus Paceibacter sp.]